jgi:putative two-component system response regulator
LAHLADSRDPETGEHLLRMRSYAQLLAEELAVSGTHDQLIDATFLENFYHCTPLHDIGKVCIPDQILLKPSALTEDEFEVMKLHTKIGAESLELAARQQGEDAFFRMAATIARWHHERFDGSGYPDRLRGEAIPIAARITALADVFDALTSARVYKEAMDPLVARRIIEAEAGKHFDPVIVAAFGRCFDRFVETRSTIDDTLGTPVIPLLWNSPHSSGAPWSFLETTPVRNLMTPPA